MTRTNFTFVSLSIFSMARRETLPGIACLKHRKKLLDNRRTNFTTPKVSCSHLTSLLDNVSVRKYLNYIEHDNSITKNPNYQEVLLKLIDGKKELELELKKLEDLDTGKDEEFNKLVEEERKKFNDDLNEIKINILSNLVNNNETIRDNKNKKSSVEIQIIPAVGGDEAKLFAEELYNMYINYIMFRNWTILLAELKGGNLEFRTGGYILLMGDSAFDHLKYEGGVHRVQRVPATETKGRTHTSTCSVFVYNKENYDDIHINEKDLEYETMRSSGPGGQNVNKLETCVRLKHLPTGIVVECQESRYQFDNKKFALEKLKNKLMKIEQEKIDSKKKALKKEQTGTNDYSDKIRTYHYSQNRVTDHRINFTMHNLPGFMTGGKDLDNLLLKLQEHGEKDQIIKYVEKILGSTEYKNFEKKMNSKT